jgi:acyl dehydratase
METDVAPRVGYSTGLHTRTIDRAKIIEYVDALHLTNPIYRDSAAARAAGFRDIIAPPSLVISFTIVPRAVKLSTFGIDESRALAGEMAFEHHVPICAGDELKGECVLVAVERKQGRRPMDVLRVETRIRNQFGDLVLVLTDSTLQWQA